MYRKDCNLAAQLLQCNKSLYRAQLSEVRPALTLHVTQSSYQAYFCCAEFSEHFLGVILSLLVFGRSPGRY